MCVLAVICLFLVSLLVKSQFNWCFRDDTFKVLSSLNPSKASGLDGIGPHVLKMCATPLCSPLCHLFSMSLQSAFIPSEWKMHNIFKLGFKNSVTNYRPISLLSSTSKVLERIVYEKVIDFLSPLFSSSQFGFLSGRSTLQQLLIFLAEIRDNLDNKVCTDVIHIYLDFCKAFGTVPHDKLLIKLWNMGISGDLWMWFQSYL